MPLAGNLDKGIDEGHSVRATPVRFRTGSTVRKRNARSLVLLVMKGLADTAYDLSTGLITLLLRILTPEKPEQQLRVSRLLP
jgi:hypothetical protein